MNMEIKEVKNKQIWEDFIGQYSPQSFFQSWNWGEVVKKFQRPSFNFQILWRWGIYHGKELVGISQIIKVIAKRGIFLHLRHGPIFKVWQREYFEFLLENLRKLSQKEKVSFIRISPLVENSQKFISFFRNFGFIDAPIHRLDGEYVRVLDLDKTLEDLLLEMRKTTRYLIRQAEKIGVKIVKSQDIKEIDEFLDLYKKTALRQHFVEHKGIREEFAELIKDNQILLFKGYFHEKLLASSLIVFYNHQAIYHHSASIPSKIPVNYLLQWEAIKEAKKRGKRIYNFWGIADEENKRHPWRGLTLFKKGFGGRLVEYLHVKDFPLTPSYCVTYLIEWVRKFWKGY